MYNYKIKYIPDLDANLVDNVQRPPQERIDQLNSENQWFIKLEQSILQNGIHNPICITAQQGHLSVRYGGSRLMIAQKHNLTIPAIVADYDNHFPHAEEAGREDPATFIRSKYKNQPSKIYFKPHGINISGCAEIHLENNK